MDPKPPNPFRNIKDEKFSSQTRFSEQFNIFQQSTSQSSANRNVSDMGNIFAGTSGGSHQTEETSHPVNRKLSTMSSSAFKAQDSYEKTVFGGQLPIGGSHQTEETSHPVNRKLSTMSSSAFKAQDSYEKTVFGGQLPINTFTESNSKLQSVSGRKIDLKTFNEEDSRKETGFGGQTSLSTVTEKDHKLQTAFDENISSQSDLNLQRVVAEESFPNSLKADLTQPQIIFGGKISNEQFSSMEDELASKYFGGNNNLSAFKEKDSNIQTVIEEHLPSTAVIDSGLPTVFGGQMSSNTFKDLKPTLPILFEEQKGRTDLKEISLGYPTSFEGKSNQFDDKHQSQESAFGKIISSNSFEENSASIPTSFGGQLALKNIKDQDSNARNVFAKPSESLITKQELLENAKVSENGNTNKTVLLVKENNSSINFEFDNEIHGCDQIKNETDNQMENNSDGKSAAILQESFSEQAVKNETLKSKNSFKDTVEENIFGNIKSSRINTEFNIEPFQLKTTNIIKPSTVNQFEENAKTLGSSQHIVERDPLDEILGVRSEPICQIKKDPTTLIAIDVPVKCLDKVILLTHFKKFGKVNKLLINRKSNQALIYFSSHAHAINAKNKGKRIHPNLPEMKLLFKAPPQTELKCLGSSAILPPGMKGITKISKQMEFNLDVQQKHIRGRSSSPSFTSSNKELYPEDIIRPSVSNEQVSLLKSETSASMERYLILDARDKAIRNKQNKILDVDRAEYLSASCPDMCPEKERYIRHVQNDICLELNNGKLDHKLVIKQFSRSSADKEEPLPYELRPGNVLKMTIDFLLCNIVDKIYKDITAEVWYNYMWNRTRAIRNDLMQQHLVDHNAIYVLERCIRFHIHCSHEFCENSMVMNPKMNDEHLSKSLQSLRELYHDMNELDQFSIAEPEFRGYEILLNLSHGDICCRYQKFRDSVRKSQPVQFAVKCMNAFHSNNYVKFFKLVQSSSYLQGCILHKYYKSMRRKSMQIIVKGYTLPNKTQLISTCYLKILLGMSEDSELKEFIETFGLILCNEGNNIKVNSAKFTSPDSYNFRKDSFILAKRKCLVSEVINGGILPLNPLNNYEPHNSFNELGQLKEEAKNATDQSAKVKYPVLKSPIKFDEELEKRLLIRTNIIYEMNLMRKSFQKWLKYLKNKKVYSQRKKERSLKLQRKFYNKWCFFVWKRSQLGKKADSYYLKKSFQKWQQFVLNKKNIRNYRLEAAIRLKKQLAVKYFTFWKIAVLKRKQISKLAAIREQFLTRKYVMVWQSIVINSRVMRDATIFYEKNVLAKYLLYWRDWNIARKLKREQMNNDYPAATTCMSIERQNKKWNWGYNREKSENVSAIDVSNLNSTINRSLHRSGNIDGDVFFNSLPFLVKLKEHINNPKFNPNLINQFMKLKVYISSDLSETFIKWIRAKFSLSETKCISRINERLTIHSEISNCQFSILVVETDNIFGADENFCQVVAFCSLRDILRFKHLIDIKNLSNKLLICESSRVDLHSKIWQLSSLSLSSPEISHDLLEKIFNLWKTSRQNCKITIAKCSSIFYDAFSRIILNPVQNIVTQRFAYGQFKISHSILICMYNEFIDHFSSCMVNRLEDIIPEDILNDSCFSTIRQNDFTSTIDLIKSIKLPPLLINENISWPNLLNYLSTYCNSTCEEWNDDIKSEIFYILESVKEKILVEEDWVDLSAIPWADIIFRLISYKMLSLEESIIVYDDEILSNFQPTEDYLSYLKIYNAPPAHETQFKNKPEEKCVSMKRKQECNIEMDSVKKKIKSHFLEELADETMKLKELEWKFQSEIDMENLDITKANKI